MQCLRSRIILPMNSRVPFRRVSVALACILGLPVTHAATWDWNNATALWSNSLAWTPNAVPLSANDTILKFGGTGAIGYTSTNDLAGNFSLRGIELNSTATAEEVIATTSSGVLGFVSDGTTNPTVTQNGTGAFNLNLGIAAANPLTFSGSGTGVVTISGVLTGPGGLVFSGANWRLTNAANNFTGGLTINTGAFVELAPGAAINITPGAATLVGSGNCSTTVVDSIEPVPSCQ